MELLQRLKGTGVALATPFSGNAPDWAALERLVEHVIAGGVEFLVPLGTTGESVATSDSENRQILDFVIRINRGRLPIVAGLFGGNNTAALTEKIRRFNFDGVDALLSSNPAYNRPSQEGIYQHYMALAEASPKPIILYNVPSRSASNMTAETTLRLAHAHTSPANTEPPRYTLLDRPGMVNLGHSSVRCMTARRQRTRGAHARRALVPQVRVVRAPAATLAASQACSRLWHTLVARRRRCAAQW